MSMKKYVDLQINGYMGVDFADPQLTADMFLATADHIFASGTALFLPTIVTSSKEVYLRNLGIMYKAAESHGLLKNIPGAHLEGPFISRKPGAVGAHIPEYVREPDSKFFDEIMDLSNGYVTLLTVAPEVPGMDEFISHVAAKGVVVSCGHQLAQSEDLARAANAPYFADIRALAETPRQDVGEGDLLLTMGAGDIAALSEIFGEALVK